MVFVCLFFPFCLAHLRRSVRAPERDERRKYAWARADGPVRESNVIDARANTRFSPYYILRIRLLRCRTSLARRLLWQSVRVRSGRGGARLESTVSAENNEPG